MISFDNQLAPRGTNLYPVDSADGSGLSGEAI